MCQWGSSVNLLVPIPAELSYTGEFRLDVKGVDECIAPIVKALNDANIYTIQSCCGHGNGDGIIMLMDGRKLTISQPLPDFHNIDPLWNELYK